jgi:hypothetical protein
MTTPVELGALFAAAVGNKELLQMIYKDAAQPGVQQVGSAIGTILGLGNTLLLPLRLLNERASAAFINNMERYRESLKDVPMSAICPVTSEIGVPILERLAYVTDETIAEMFVQLLSSASQTSHADEVHPAFVHVIDNMSPDEAKLIRAISLYKHNVYGTFQIVPPGTQHVLGQGKYLLSPRIVEGAQLVYPEYAPAYIENLKRLGILESFLHSDPEKHLREELMDIQRTYEKLVAEEPLNTVPGAVCWHFGYIVYSEFGRFFKWSIRQKSQADADIGGIGS